VYRVQLESGDEKSYRSLEELVVDADAGVLTPGALIFHAASTSWVSVTRHPRLVSRFPTSARSSEPLLDFDVAPEPPPFDLTRSSDFLSSVPPMTSSAVPAPPPEQAAAEPPLDGGLPPLPNASESSGPLPDYRPPSDWKPDRSFAPLFRVLGLTLTLAVLGGGGWYAWHVWAERRTARAVAEAEAAASSVRAQPVDTIPDSVLVKALKTLEEADTAGAGQARAIALRDRLGDDPIRPIDKLRAMTPAELRRSYVASYASARAAMDSDFAAAGVRHLFATTRLATPDSLQAGRRLVQAARNILRVYLSTEVRIERAFRDTVAFQTRTSGWGTGELNDWKSRAILKESYEGAQLADSILRHVDDAYRLLLDQSGRYRVGAGQIAFEDTGASNEYARLAAWLTARHDAIDALDEQSEQPRPNPTARRVVRAFGGIRPPTLNQGGAAPAP
jgi:hypothetical protein